MTSDSKPESGASIADSASAKVARIISAAEETAAEIVGDARAEADAIVERARTEARDQVERAETALAALATQAGELQSEISTDGRDEAGVAAAAGAAERSTHELEDQVRSAAEDAGAPDNAAARLVAMNMALEGSSQEEITQRLTDEFRGIGDSSELASEVLARAGRS